MTSDYFLLACPQKSPSCQSSTILRAPPFHCVHVSSWLGPRDLLASPFLSLFPSPSAQQLPIVHPSVKAWLAAPFRALPGTFPIILHAALPYFCGLACCGRADRSLVAALTLLSSTLLCFSLGPFLSFCHLDTVFLTFLVSWPRSVFIAFVAFVAFVSFLLLDFSPCAYISGHCGRQPPPQKRILVTTGRFSLYFSSPSANLYSAVAYASSYPTLEGRSLLSNRTRTKTNNHRHLVPIAIVTSSRSSRTQPCRGRELHGRHGLALALAYFL